MGTRFLRLTGLALTRDRWRLVVWLLVLAGLFSAVAAKFEAIYGTPTEIAAILGTLKSPAIVAMFGKFTYHGTITTAQVFANEMLVFMALMQIIMSLNIGIHATRFEEDRGLTDLLRAHAVGPMAPLYAAMAELTLLNATLGLLYTAGLSLAAMPGTTVAGNWAIGLGLAGIGWVFGLLSLVTAQLTDHAASATGLAYVVFGLCYLGRMLTDVQAPHLTWYSPIGWLEKLAPYQTINWWPLVLLGLTGGLLATLAVALATHRDLGAGMLATRPGRRTASPLLRGPLSLLWRRKRRVLLGWLIGVAVLGAAYGTVFNTIGDILKTNPTMQRVFGSAAVHAANHQLLLSFSSLLVMVLAAVAIIPGLQVIFTLASDETRGWLEGLAARPLSRTRLFLSYGGLASLVSTLIFAVGWGSLLLTGNASLTHATDGLSAFAFWQGFWGLLPVIWLFLVLGIAFVGIWPQGRLFVWGYLAYGFISQYLGSLLRLPHWAKQLTPLGWQAAVPVHAVDWGPFVGMFGLGLVITLLGWWRYTHRDFQLR